MAAAARSLDGTHEGSSQGRDNEEVEQLTAQIEKLRETARSTIAGGLSLCEWREREIDEILCGKCEPAVHDSKASAFSSAAGTGCLC
jgi:hypothetical protein